MGVKFQQVVDFYRYLIELGGIYEVDGDNYITRRDDDSTPVTMKVKGKIRPLLILQEKITDDNAIIINVLNENLRESIDSKWMYAMLAGGLYRRLYNIIETMQIIISAPDESWDADTLDFVSKYSARVDARLLSHFKIVTDKKLEFTNVFYNRKLKQAIFRCKLFETIESDEFSNITKKSMKTMIDIFSELFDVPKVNPSSSIMEKFSSKSDLITSPKIDAILRTYLKVYTQLNPFLNKIDPDLVVDLTTMGNYIEMLPDLYDKVKWFSGVASDVGAPGTKDIKVATSAIPLGNEPVQMTLPVPESSTSEIPLGTSAPMMHQHQLGSPPMMHQQQLNHPLQMMNNAPPQYGGFNQQALPQQQYNIPIR